jgi:hypothetical protein
MCFVNGGNHDRRLQGQDTDPIPGSTPANRKGL